MRKIFILFLFSIEVLYSQTREFKLGLYIRDNTKKMQQIEPTVISDKNINILFMPFLEKPNMTVYLDKKQTVLFTHTDKPEFFLFMPSPKDTVPLDALNVSNLIKNYPLAYASSANDFVLIRLFDMKRGKALRLEKQKLIYGSKMDFFKEDKIEFNAIQIDDGFFKIEMPTPLQKGDYGFIYNKPTPYDIVIYHFQIQ